MIDLTRLMFDDGATRSPVVQNRLEAHTVGDIKYYLTTIQTLDDRRWNVYRVVSLPLDGRRFIGYWVEKSQWLPWDEQGDYASMQAYLAIFSRRPVPGWGQRGFAAYSDIGQNDYLLEFILESEGTP